MADPSKTTVLIAESEPADLARSTKVLESAGFLVRAATEGRSALKAIYADPPRCIILGHGTTGAEEETLLADLKADNIYGHLPVILTVSAHDLEGGMDWTQVPTDDYLLKPFSDAELLSRVRLCLARANRDVYANPLSGLPGNIPIMQEAEKRITMGEPFAMAYLDIDEFKAFNDVYGFVRGDEVLRMTARILVSAVQSLGRKDTYVGHIGGDDFVLITPPDVMPRACRYILEYFDSIVPHFYDEADQARGGIQSIDRQGNLQRYPLMSLSIAVIDTQATKVEHLGDLSRRAAQLKQFAKQGSGSKFIVDRRT